MFYLVCLIYTQIGTLNWGLWFGGVADGLLTSSFNAVLKFSEAEELFAKHLTSTRTTNSLLFSPQDAELNVMFAKLKQMDHICLSCCPLDKI